MTAGSFARERRLHVVLFSGGRGSRVLSKELINHPSIALTVAVNGYDDGLSTGEVRRFLGDSLGPSDFRKNATRLARELRTCPAEFCDLLEARLPVGCTADDWLQVLSGLRGDNATAPPPFDGFTRLSLQLDAGSRQALTSRLSLFEAERTAAARPFDFSDCCLGNLVFAGAFLGQQRAFNAALDDFCTLVGLPAGVIEDVTDGTNAFLVALDLADRVLGSEGEIVDAKRRNYIKDIYLIDRALTASNLERLRALPVAEVVGFLNRRAKPVALNPRLRDRIGDADLIIYSPGTQHSSLFPSYITPGLSAAIARNLTAIKLLITNIQPDAEIPDSSAVDIIERAVYYLKEKGRLDTPTPCLITHYLLNDPGRAEGGAPHIPLGRLDSLEDPRLVRIANYEEGASGRHDAAKVLTPFIQSFLGRDQPRRVAVWLHDANSLNKVSQTLLEMVRAGVARVPVELTVFYGSEAPLASSFAESLPFAVERVPPRAGAAETLQRAGGANPFDYVILFESSGMYNGEDVVSLASSLSADRLDAVWGSRRLSLKDIRESLQVRYRHNVWIRVASAVGSHLISVLYLVLYGRYVSDSLSGARAVRTAFLGAAAVDLPDKLANQRLLATLLRGRAEMLETPVRFLPLSPERVRRTRVFEGVQALGTILWWRIRRLAPRAGAAPGGSAAIPPP